MYKFYLNKRWFEPNGEFIKVILKQWQDSYAILEYNHSYIQWLFPLQEQGRNEWAKKLTKPELAIMKQNKEVQQRLLEAYKLMLKFYGITLTRKDTREVKRFENFEEKFENLNSNSHNNLRIIRILKCLREQGGSVLNYFMFTMKNKQERRDLIYSAWEKYEPRREFIWGPREKLHSYKKIQSPCCHRYLPTGLLHTLKISRSGFLKNQEDSEKMDELGSRDGSFSKGVTSACLKVDGKEPVERDRLKMCVRAGVREEERGGIRCEGMGSSGHVVRCEEDNKELTSSSVAGRKRQRVAEGTCGSGVRVLLRKKPNSEIIPQDTEPSIMPQDTEASIIPQDTEASIIPQDTEASIMPQDTEASIMPHDTEASIMPQDTEASIIPQDTEASIIPQDTEASIMPQDTEASIMPQDKEVSIMPQDTEASIIPQDMETSIMPQDTEASIIPQDTETSIMPQDTEASIIPQDTETSIIDEPNTFGFVFEPELSKCSDPNPNLNSKSMGLKIRF
uniref:Opioid growth factor receptor (OGFr) conserved domain-containing protein n=1 Tax=Leptobrachium leishanense TaxID=445787 RepID=A0A8C5PRM3_9ANUR